MLTRFNSPQELGIQHVAEQSSIRRSAVAGMAAAMIIPAFFSAGSSEAHVLETESYPDNVVAYDLYGFHSELADKPIAPSGNPERANIERCVNLTLNSLRKYSFQTSRDGERVKESTQADSVEECLDVVDRNIDIHFDMDRMALRDNIGDPDEPVKKIGLDPNSNVKVIKNDGVVNQTNKMILFHKPTPTIGKKRRNFQMVVGLKATVNSTGEMYRKSFKTGIRWSR